MPENVCKGSIALIGVMGAGKSRVGKALAERLTWNFVDLDQWIEEQCGRSVAEIFELYGEAYFRRLETEAVQEWAQRPKVVISTGGGVVLQEVNKLALERECSIVYLRATLATLWKRVRRSRHRPLLRTPDPKARLRDILASREQSYLSWADLIVDTDQLSIEGVVDTVMREMNLEEHYADGQCESRQE